MQCVWSGLVVTRPHTPHYNNVLTVATTPLICLLSSAIPQPLDGVALIVAATEPRIPPSQPTPSLTWPAQPLDGVALIAAAEAAAAETARCTAECVAIAEAEDQQQAATAASLSSGIAEEALEQQQQQAVPSSEAALGFPSNPLTDVDMDDHYGVGGASSGNEGSMRLRHTPASRPAAAAAGALLVDVPLPLEGEPSAGAAPHSLLDEDGGGGSSSAPFTMVQGIERHSTSRGRCGRNP